MCDCCATGSKIKESEVGELQKAGHVTHYSTTFFTYTLVYPWVELSYQMRGVSFPRHPQSPHLSVMYIARHALERRTSIDIMLECRSERQPDRPLCIHTDVPKRRPRLPNRAHIADCQEVAAQSSSSRCQPPLTAQPTHRLTWRRRWHI